jgi:hypothetical protein
MRKIAKLSTRPQKTVHSRREIFFNPLSQPARNV